MASLDSDWLSVELDSINEEIAQWNDGIKESFNSLCADADAKSRPPN
jgi:hypothetical protein